MGLARAQGYGLHFDEYLRTANTKIALILMIEHKDPVEQVDEIVAIPGVDAILKLVPTIFRQVWDCRDRLRRQRSSERWSRFAGLARRQRCHTAPSA